MFILINIKLIKPTRFTRQTDITESFKNRKFIIRNWVLKLKLWFVSILNSRPKSLNCPTLIATISHQGKSLSNASCIYICTSG